MKIQKITNEHRNDFWAILECEHCNATQELRSGYHDTYYHGVVLPNISCQSCGKNSAGDFSNNPTGGRSV